MSLVPVNFISILYAVAIVLILNSGASGADVEFYRTRGYKQQPIPQEWCPANSNGAIRDLREVAGDYRWPDGKAKGDFSVKGFIARYGMPDQYWERTSGKRDWDYLVYHRPDGTILMYVPKPPGTNFGAVAIWDRKGNLLDLIK